MHNKEKNPLSKKIISLSFFISQLCCINCSVYCMDSKNPSINTNFIKKSSDGTRITLRRDDTVEKQILDLENQTNQALTRMEQIYQESAPSKSSYVTSCFKVTRDCCSMAHNAFCIFMICFSVYVIVFLARAIPQFLEDQGDNIKNIDWPFYKTTKNITKN